jgi:hypothetical protein
MSQVQKDMLARWAPLLVALVTNLIVVAYGYGKLEQRLSPIEGQLAGLQHDKLAGIYVTRVEFQMRTTQRDREMANHAEWMGRIESKLDRLLERHTENRE